jgi:hypothetical protein
MVKYLLKPPWLSVRVISSQCGCMEFRNIDLPAGRCWLRRVLRSKPTSTEVEGQASLKRLHKRSTASLWCLPRCRSWCIPRWTCKCSSSPDELPEQLLFDLSSAAVNHEWVSEIVEAAEEHDLALLLSGKQQRHVSPGKYPVAAMKRMLWTNVLNSTS